VVREEGSEAEECTSRGVCARAALGAAVDLIVWEPVSTFTHGAIHLAPTAQLHNTV
jgi:hypothetical protein